MSFAKVNIGPSISSHPVYGTQFTIYAHKKERKRKERERERARGRKRERRSRLRSHSRTQTYLYTRAHTPFLLIFSQRTYTFIICFHIYFSLEIKKNMEINRLLFRENTISLKWFKSFSSFRICVCVCVCVVVFSLCYSLTHMILRFFLVSFFIFFLFFIHSFSLISLRIPSTHRARTTAAVTTVALACFTNKVVNQHRIVSHRIQNSREKFAFRVFRIWLVRSIVCLFVCPGHE